MSAQGCVLERLLAERIVVLDGAMGTMIQQHKLCPRRGSHAPLC